MIRKAGRTHKLPEEAEIEIAMAEAVAEVIEENKRLRLPLISWDGKKVVKIPAEDAITSDPKAILRRWQRQQKKPRKAK